jgi:BirA family transcriptional regulator, biotin operon repressor / biotin---[acetyl-CoA-carboxylase] ligase
MPHSDSRQPLDVDALRATLRPQHAWRRLDVVSSTGSTNADLLSRAQSDVDVAGSVLLAEFQSAGRGRHGRNWATPPRAQIAMSVGIDVTGIAAEKWGWIPLLTGVALVDSVAQVCGVSVGLKWPNDVLAGADKLAGVLAEVASPSPVIVIGLGLNVSLTPEELPTPTATSLQILGATALDRNVLVSAILDRLGAGVPPQAMTISCGATICGAASPSVRRCGPSCRAIATSSVSQRESTSRDACSSTTAPTYTWWPQATSRICGRHPARRANYPLSAAARGS